MTPKILSKILPAAATSQWTTFLNRKKEDRVAPISERQRPYPRVQQIPGYSSWASIVSSMAFRCKRGRSNSKE